MKCEECQKLVEEYFDGELAELRAAQVSLHLSACANCSRQLEALRAEQNLYATYRREVEVRASLWAGVAGRIKQAEGARRPPSFIGRWRESLAGLFGTPRLSPALAFALIILAVGATAGLMKYLQAHKEAAGTQAVSSRQPEAEKVAGTAANTNAPRNANDKEETARDDKSAAEAQPKEKAAPKAAQNLTVAYAAEGRRPVKRPESLASEQTPDQLVREAEQKYKAAIAMLQRDAKRRRTLLEPDVLARFDQTLAAVDQTIRETRRAARRQPDDPTAAQYMLAAYDKKVEVLREMASYRADARIAQ
jgi:predicted lipid-binding transport protein (Tim44 family)